MASEDSRNTTASAPAVRSFRTTIGAATSAAPNAIASQGVAPENVPNAFWTASATVIVGVPRPYDHSTAVGAIHSASTTATAMPLAANVVSRRVSHPRRTPSAPSTASSAATGNTAYSPDSTTTIALSANARARRPDGACTTAANASRFANVASTQSE